ncbi:hypothetical protein [Amycolatopsis taiwanensis]|nr:hypothetical protein [Amycolatopsis taiwanensis]
MADTETALPARLDTADTPILAAVLRDLAATDDESEASDGESEAR